MGYDTFSHSAYTSKSATRAASGINFAYDHAIKTGKVQAGPHPDLSPVDLYRESKDSETHPDSVAIGVIFDETGSMGEVPLQMQASLGKLMKLLIDRDILQDPQVLFGAVGDANNREKAPVQIGQFESGIAMDDDLEKIYLEHKGGGSYEESYELIFYAFARHTEIDCWLKRQKKGYLFIVGDEKSYPTVDKQIVSQVFGDNLPNNINTKDMVKELQERYHVFFIIPPGTFHFNDPILVDFWNDMLGSDYVHKLQDPSAICEMVAGLISVEEGKSIDFEAAGDKAVEKVEKQLADLAAKKLASIEPDVDASDVSA